jgi:hypothetical protein
LDTGHQLALTNQRNSNGNVGDFDALRAFSERSSEAVKILPHYRADSIYHDSWNEITSEL